MINRNTIIVRPKQPYINWISQLDNSKITPDQNNDYQLALGD